VSATQFCQYYIVFGVCANTHHSTRYGSVVATHLLKDPIVSDQIASVVLVDPPTIMLHLPDVAYNFVCLEPSLSFPSIHARNIILTTSLLR
jgi:hypothetical protein